MNTSRSFRTAVACGTFLVALFFLSQRSAFAQWYSSPLGPNVRITSPANHATFYAPVDIALFAYARAGNNFNGNFTNVEFYANGTNIGSAVGLGSGYTGIRPIYGITFPPLAVPALSPMYCLVWTNGQPGSYALTAVARGADPWITPFGSLASTSAPVNITILPSTTNSNPIDIVSIVAADSVAIASTNAYWVWPCMTNTIPSWTNWPPIRWALCTNWGPKNAIFNIRRFGDVSADLTVKFRISGTASNGMDYAMLTNFIILPAGKAYTLIPIVPIDNRKTNFSKTVTLTLTANTNLPPSYLVGLPNTASALILDNWRRPLPFLLPSGGGIHVNASGPDGSWFAIQSSSDLQNWTSISTNQVFQGAIDFVDPNPPAISSQFYRAWPLTNTPAN